MPPERRPYTARLTLDITPAMRARIKVSAFTQGVTVADLLRACWSGNSREVLMNTPASTASAPPSIPPVGVADGVPLTRVALAYIDQRFELYLRFGEPARTHPARPLAALRVPAGGSLPHPLAGQRLRHDPLAAHGDAGLHAAGRRSASPACSRARACCCTPRVSNRCAPCWRIDAIEALGIAPVGVSPAYWRTLANRLAALAAARIHRRAARRLAGREGAAMTAVSTSGTAPHPRSRLRARLVLAGLSACGLAALAWASFVHPLPRLTYNPSDSVAVGWYRVDPLDHRTSSLPRPLSVGSIVLVPLPPRPPRCCAARLPADARSAAQARGRGRAARGVHR
jgi:hypothetical protein